LLGELQAVGIDSSLSGAVVNGADKAYGYILLQTAAVGTLVTIESLVL
jgi:hypothetical protein